MSWKGDYAGDGTLRVGRVDLVCSRVRKVSPAGLEEKKEAVRPAKSEKTRAKKQKKFVKKRCPAGLRGEKETVRPEKREKTGLEEKKELVRPAESEKTEEIREKEVPCGSERGKRDRETREVSEGGEKMQKILIVVDMQNDFVDGALGTPEAVAIVPRVEQKIREFPGKVIFTRDTHGERYLETQEGKHLPVPHCIKGTKGWEICPQLEALREAEAIDKVTFGSEKLGELLQEENRKEQIEDITLVGLCTDICVISNALLLKAFLPETPIIVDASCCAGVTPKSHETALDAMRMCQINIER